MLSHTGSHLHRGQALTHSALVPSKAGHSRGQGGRSGQGAPGLGMGGGLFGGGGPVNPPPRSHQFMGAKPEPARVLPLDGSAMAGEVRPCSLGPLVCWWTHVASRAAQTMDREARVLRYKEKRKNRKFDKTIRCALPAVRLHRLIHA